MANTPRLTGETAHSWDYRVTRSSSSITIAWYNNNIVGDTPLAILIQYGHGTRQGAFVKGEDFINPAMRPIFDEIADEAWEELTK